MKVLSGVDVPLTLVAPHLSPRLSRGGRKSFSLILVRDLPPPLEGVVKALGEARRPGVV